MPNGGPLDPHSPPLETPRVPGGLEPQTPSRARPAVEGEALAPASVDTRGPLAGVRTEGKRVLDGIYHRLELTGIDFFQSAMHTGYGWFLRWLSWTFFRLLSDDEQAPEAVSSV